MASINLIDSFQEFKDAENIDRPTLMKVMEDVFKTLIRKKYGSDECFDVIVNDQKGDLEIFRRRTIVDTKMQLRLSLITRWVKSCMKKWTFRKNLAAGQYWPASKPLRHVSTT